MCGEVQSGFFPPVVDSSVSCLGFGEYFVSTLSSLGTTDAFSWPIACSRRSLFKGQKNSRLPERAWTANLLILGTCRRVLFSSSCNSSDGPSGCVFSSAQRECHRVGTISSNQKQVIKHTYQDASSYEAEPACQLALDGSFDGRQSPPAKYVRA